VKYRNILLALRSRGVYLIISFNFYIMTQNQPFINTNSSSSSIPSGSTNFPVNSELNELVGQVASLLNIGQLHNILGILTEHLKFLSQRVD
jgi:hypothetical protein